MLERSEKGSQRKSVPASAIFMACSSHVRALERALRTQIAPRALGTMESSGKQCFDQWRACTIFERLAVNCHPRMLERRRERARARACH
eukprot:142291-Karenia_brevis.AAC.1